MTSRFINVKILTIYSKRPFWIFYLCLSFFLLGQFILAQENSTIPSFSFEKFKLPEGHLGNSVQDIVQDVHGFMWFASKNGLHRWDGFEFTANFDGCFRFRIEGFEMTGTSVQPEQNAACFRFHSR